MGQISVKTYAPKGSDLSGNQHRLVFAVDLLMRFSSMAECLSSFPVLFGPDSNASSSLSIMVFDWWAPPPERRKPNVDSLKVSAFL